jgi:hypothetical protein
VAVAVKIPSRDNFAETVMRGRCHADMRTLIILLFTSSAFASTGEHHFVGAANGGHVDLVSFTRHDHGRATLKLTLSTTSKEMREVSVPIAVPDHMIAFDLSSASLAGYESSAYTVSFARHTYDRYVKQIKDDPILLEWRSDGTLLLTVFPMTSYATEEISIELEATSQDIHVDEHTSLMLVPENHTRDDLYADYWPRHD